MRGARAVQALEPVDDVIQTEAEHPRLMLHQRHQRLPRSLLAPDRLVETLLSLLRFIDRLG